MTVEELAADLLQARMWVLEGDPENLYADQLRAVAALDPGAVVDLVDRLVLGAVAGACATACTAAGGGVPDLAAALAGVVDVVRHPERRR